MSNEVKILIVVDPAGMTKDLNIRKSVSDSLRRKISSLVKDIKDECNIKSYIEVETIDDYGLFWEMGVEDPEDI